MTDLCATSKARTLHFKDKKKLTVRLECKSHSKTLMQMVIKIFRSHGHTDRETTSFHKLELLCNLAKKDVFVKH